MGPGMYAMMFWIPLGMLLCVALVAGAIWLVARWLNPNKTPTMPYTPQSHNSYQSYEQGYQPTQWTYQEGGQQYRYSPQSPPPKQEYEEPGAQYPQQMPPIQQ